MSTWEQRRRRIYGVVQAIPSGRVASYGDVAALASLPRGARQVGRALRETPTHLDLPWHRVLRADGRIAFDHGSESANEQSMKLHAEGVPCLRGRVDMALYRWQPNLDELLWGRLGLASQQGLG